MFYRKVCLLSGIALGCTLIAVGFGKGEMTVYAAVDEDVPQEAVNSIISVSEDMLSLANDTEVQVIEDIITDSVTTKKEVIIEDVITPENAKREKRVVIEDVVVKVNTADVEGEGVTTESKEKTERKDTTVTESKDTISAATLSPKLGKVNGPSGEETYYNLEMNGVVEIMRNLGYSSEEYPYWVREDGCKMFGDYIMVAADLSIHPRGEVLECSLGKAMVCDTGSFIQENPYRLDVAVNW